MYQLHNNGARRRDFYDKLPVMTNRHDLDVRHIVQADRSPFVQLEVIREAPICNARVGIASFGD